MSDDLADVAISVPGSDRDSEATRGRRRSRRRLTKWFVVTLAELTAVQAAILVATLILQLFGTRTIAASWDIAIGHTATLAVLGPTAIFGVYDRTVTCAWDRLRIRFYVAAALPWTGTAFLAVMQPLRIGSVQILVITAAVYLPFSMLADAFVRRLLFCWLDWGANVLVVGSGALAQSVVQGTVCETRARIAADRILRRDYRQQDTTAVTSSRIHMRCRKAERRGRCRVDCALRRTVGR